VLHLPQKARLHRSSVPQDVSTTSHFLLVLPMKNENKDWFFMATINFRYDEKGKEALRKEGEQLGFRSFSDYMVAIVEARHSTKAPAQPIRIKKTITPVGRTGQTAKTRVTPAEKKRLAEFCEEEGESESFLLLRQIRILLNNAPHFSKEEVHALRLATSQITAIGRNLNQIVARINSGVITDTNLHHSYLTQLKKNIDDQALAIRHLIKKTKDRVVEYSGK
jgi:hypothetical protein